MKAPKLLSRDDFREGVFSRDGHRCVFCGETENLDAHHIIERRLFTAEHEKGGYFLDNGATVCEEHHRACEATTISCYEVREAAGITRVILPSYAYDDIEYDKWLNPLMPNGTRLKGPLFWDKSVQKILAAGDVLGLFSKYVKHPRLSHLPWSTNL